MSNNMASAESSPEAHMVTEDDVRAAYERMATQRVVQPKSTLGARIVEDNTLATEEDIRAAYYQMSTQGWAVSDSSPKSTIPEAEAAPALTLRLVQKAERAILIFVIAQATVSALMEVISKRGRKHPKG